MSEPAPAPQGPSRQPKRRWPVGLLVAFITAIAAAFAVIPVADWVMEMHHVSQMEGGRACAVVGLWMPAAGMAGFGIGFIVTLLVRRGGFVGYLIPQGLALGIVGVVIGAAAGIGYATADHPPLLNDKGLALEIEAQLPTKGRSIGDFKQSGLAIALVVSDSDRNYSDLRWVDGVESNDSLYITAWAVLRSRNGARIITVETQGESPQMFDVNLPAVPKTTSNEWTEWQPPRARMDGSKPAPNEQYLVRYRVRFAEEYSPTPPPESESTASPEPTEADEPATPAAGQEADTNSGDSLNRGLLPSPAETPQ